MALSSLTAVTPIDGRYYNNTNELSAFFSEFALIKYRVRVEVEYFIALSESGIAQLQQFDKTLNEKLRDIYRNFSEEDAIWIKNTEKVTNHDVKAVEYFLKDQFEKLGLQDYLEFIHFGLTSQDINNTAIPLSWKEAIKESYTPAIEELLHELKSLATSWSEIPMLARTHGQPASPTRLGKEFYVFIERIERQLQLLQQVPYSAKFGGATGNFNAHHVAYPATNWIDFGNNFVNNILGLDRSQTTTQIEHYDNFAASCDALKRINNIVIDLCRDIWTYISMEYFKQKITAGQIGSSAMPHKVNPIDFENAEGNLGIANAIFEHLAAKLPVSRLQRDLTDSTVLRNIGVPFAHTLIAIKSTLRGLRKLILNEQALANDLENNWAVVAEALQTILRREGYPKPYEALKDLTRTNTHVTKETIATFVDNLNVSAEVKAELKAISPSNYTGITL
ncbi:MULTISPECIES: adenylosuccinate lyase [Sphingobacterium]|jgi:adenylosuccinate lyase|uniref:Adenylosuccinate lyase n=1 Tax=Sphingobacterium multivorum TaxID=28454 RepID=A0A2X2JBK6_SPHMU|nr:MULTISPECIES: adenylosuccinate lyase [Sphingobacterium]HAE67645.1 adenylosuccinate lyase [Sphingobacterium sp.]MDF2853986.1 adenylosuccinate lyase [Sphingobacterium multivorum]OFV17979.1 adenylosuccinate lyase [Sphingobacterium sp. HMSC13C05]QRQ60330.1 adenylosuccinate lyase [Sphingobacterium multivorum]SPZ91737.1 Adenylosuccinate lyase [Sphingobacterium multivorum]